MLDFRVVDPEIARSDPLGAVMLVGDYSAFTYVICHASKVKATPAALRLLAIDLDAIFMRSPIPEATDVQWMITNPWQEWASEASNAGIWINKRLIARGVLPECIYDVLSGKAERLKVMP